MRRPFWTTLCAVFGLFALGGAVMCAARLDQGGFAAHIFVAAATVALALLALLLLKLDRAHGGAMLAALLPIGIALLFRVLCLDYASLDYQDFLSKWYEYFASNGGFRAMAGSIGDYNVPYLYFMAAISYLKLPNLYMIKLFSVLFDILLAWGGFRLVRVLRGGRHRDPAPVIAFALLLLLPTVALNGACWGQCDSLYAALVVHAMAQVLSGRNKSSVILLAVAFSFKLQTVFLIPLWGVLWLAKRVKLWELLLFPVTYAVTIVPALLMGKPLGEILGVYLNQMEEYSYRLTLNAPSVFQFVPYGAEVNADLLSKLGIVAAGVVAVAMLVLGWLLRRRLSIRTAMAMAAVMAIGIPFFLPYMHERYFFLADVICLCWACAAPRHTPAAVLAAGSSLASYLVYLRLEYNWVFLLGGKWFVMGGETIAMLAALLFSAVMLVLELKKGGKKRETGIVECERPESLPEEGLS